MSKPVFPPFRLAVRLLPLVGLFHFSSIAAQAVDCAAMLKGLCGPASDVSMVPKEIQKLSEEKVKQLTSERVCIKNFPWSLDAHQAFFEEGKPNWNAKTSGQLRTDVHAATQAPAVHAMMAEFQKLPREEIDTFENISRFISVGVFTKEDLMSKMGKRDKILLHRLYLLSEVERRTAIALAKGGDAEQIRLYADFLYCSSPDLNAKTVKAVVAEARGRSGLHMVQEVALDNVEEATYFSKQSLINMLIGVEFQARAMDDPADLKSTMDLVGDYLDARPVLAAHFETCGDPTEQVLGRITDGAIDELGLSAPAWQRMQLLGQHEALQGFINTQGKTILFVGKTKANAIEFDGFEWTVLSRQEAEGAFRGHCSEKIATASDGNMRLYCTYPTQSGRIVEFPHSEPMLLSAADEASLKAGNPLPKDHPLSQKLASGENNVLFSTPFMEKESSALTDADSFSFSLQKAYPEAKFIRDPLSENTSDYVEKVANFKVRSPSDLMVVLSDPAQNVPLAKVIANIAPELAEAKVNVTTFTGAEKYSGPGGKAVFVISGHSSDQLGAYVRQLGEAGFLKDNFVVFNACGTELTRQMVTEINGRYGAIGTYAFQGEIPFAAVQDYLFDLVEGLTGNSSFELIKILNKAVMNRNMVGLFTVCME